MATDFEARESATTGRPGSTIERRSAHIQHMRAHPNCQRCSQRKSARTGWIDGKLTALCLECFRATHGVL
jgi:hypothetical protein